MNGDSAGRGFREVDIAITSVQPGRERSAPSHDRSDPIYPAYWRNNLTAFSQHANLLFVAVLDQIHVYQPEFPTQRLTKKIFSWRVATSGVARRGYISPQNPHWINRLAVGDFGTEEVIATAHDEGDFIVCTIRSVCRAIHSALAQEISFQEAADRCIRYLCRKNVEQSAWGIAIHQSARLLAVSANTKNVTVLAPALVGESKQDAPSNILARSEDKVYLLTGHEANIPAIAFCNTPDDPDGRFLVSTDINGGIIVWDIWKQCGLKKIAMSVGPEDAHILGENFLGWSVTCLDPRAFRSVGNDVELVGFSRQSCKRATSTVDISPARKNLRDFQFWHESDPRRLRTRGRMIRSQEGNSAGVGDGDDEANDYDYDEDVDLLHFGEDEDEDDSDDEDDDGFEFDEAFDVADQFEGIDMFDDNESVDSDVMYDAVDFGPTPANEAAMNMESLDDVAGNLIASTSALPDTNSLPPISTLNLPPAADPRHPPFAPHNRGSGQHHTREAPTPAPKAPEVEFPFAILHSGKRIVTLLRPPFDNAATVCIDPCHEHLPAAVLNLGTYERLNLSSYIPELGIVVLATQKGRAAIFSLTTLPTGVPSEPTSAPHGSSHRRRNSGSAGGSGDESDARQSLRLDWVLPFKSQENAEHRPWAPLLGVATAPVQGCQRQWPATLADGTVAAESSRQPVRPLRFRLFLMYVDNTILAYELYRDEDRGDQLLVI